MPELYSETLSQENNKKEKQDEDEEELYETVNSEMELKFLSSVPNAIASKADCPFWVREMRFNTIKV